AERVRRVAFSPDGRYLRSLDTDDVAKYWDTTTFRETTEDRVSDVEFEKPLRKAPGVRIGSVGEVIHVTLFSTRYRECEQLIRKYITDPQWVWLGRWVWANCNAAIATTVHERTKTTLERIRSSLQTTAPIGQLVSSE
ncbi:MAG: hypothetical protein ACP6IT_10935, partial [Candidatus Thorarchaeota archaeon]